MASKWYEIQILKEDGSVIGVDDRSFNDIISGGHRHWDPTKDIVVWLIKFKYEEDVLANYIFGEIQGAGYDTKKGIYTNHSIRPLA
jgi:hypothetical protein